MLSTRDAQGESSSLAVDEHELEDEEFWFTDGNVILVSEDISFRVHQGVVSRHSEVFRDLFTVPQPANEERRFDCPVVYLSDSPTELRHLLRVLYDGRKYYLKRREEQLDFVEVAALVRLAQKYQIEDLREDGIALLKACFPDNFKIWENSLNKGQTHYNSSFMRFEPTDAIAAVDLARRTDTLSMLPIALYLCSTLKSSYLIRGVPHADGTTDQLCPEDLERCLEARTYLLNRNMTVNQQMYEAVSQSCLNRPRCSIILERALSHRLMNSVGAKAHNVLQSSDAFLESLARSFQLCKECLSHIKSKSLVAREEVFNDLPTFFGLTIPDWNHGELRFSDVLVAPGINLRPRLSRFLALSSRLVSQYSIFTSRCVVLLECTRSLTRSLLGASLFHHRTLLLMTPVVFGLATRQVIRIFTAYTHSDLA